MNCRVYFKSSLMIQNKLQPRKLRISQAHGMNCWLVISLLCVLLSHTAGMSLEPLHTVCFRLALNTTGSKAIEQGLSCWVPNFSSGVHFSVRSVLLEIHQEIWFRIRTACSKTVSLISTFQTLLNAWLGIQSRNS